MHTFIPVFYYVFLPFIELFAAIAGFVGLLMIGSKVLHQRKPDATSIRLFVFSLVFFVLLKILFPKPDQQDLVGRYHLAKVTVPDFDQSTKKNYTLNFLPNGRYTVTPFSDLDLGEAGTYIVDYSSSLNELQFTYKYEFGAAGLSAHIDRRLGGYRIEFIVGDPDLGESYYFEKDSQ